MLTPGQDHDLTCAEPLIENADPEALIGDKAYDADPFVETLTQRGITPVIPPKGCRPECGRNLRVAISSGVKLSDCRFAFKQFPGREGEPLGSPLVSFSRGVRYLSTPFLSVSITRQDLSVDR